ncbi:uncharacterized protein LOC142333119 isoform X2 [Lycorma delicatula]|uniref:uncharacterized protein LOC142333119 isoform X2 n=1 Tax=Lycorma delicatula TaxID=130591 RepID=UPI003F50E5E4
MVVGCTILTILVNCLWYLQGPYDVLFKNVSECKNMGKRSITYGTEIQKINKTYYLYTNNVTLNIEVTNNNQPLRIIAKSKTKKSSKWSVFVDVTGKACDMIETYAKDIATNFFLAAGVEYKCPIKKGTYQIKNFVINLNRLANVPVLPYGDGTAEISLYSLKRNRKVLESCYKLWAEIAPKVK